MYSDKIFLDIIGNPNVHKLFKMASLKEWFEK